MRFKIKSILLVILTFALVTTLSITSFAKTSVKAEKAAIQVGKNEEEKPLDLEILVDKSEAVEKGNFVKNAAIDFSNKILQANPNNRVAVINFNEATIATATTSDSAVDINYTNDIEAVKKAINENEIKNNLQAAVNLSKDNLLANVRAGSKKVILLITDGDKNQASKNAEINAEIGSIKLEEVSWHALFKSEDLKSLENIYLDGYLKSLSPASSTATAVDIGSGATATPKLQNKDVLKNLEVHLTDVYTNLGEEVSLGAGGFSENQNVMSDITGSDGNGIFQYEWAESSNNGTIISTEKNPKVKPSGDTMYQLTVTDSNGNKGKANMWVRPRGKITITKQVNGIESSESQRKFNILLTGPSGEIYELYLKNGESRTINGLEIGEYKISELQPMNFISVGESLSSYSVSINEPSPTVTVISERNNGSWFYDEDEAQ